MNEQQLYAIDKNGEFKAQDIWFCGECKKMVTARPTKENAAQCCKPKFCECGNEISDEYKIKCDTCRRRDFDEKQWKITEKRLSEAVEQSDVKGESLL